MKIGVLFISGLFLLCNCVESASESDSLKILADVFVNGKVIVAGTYGVQIDEDSDVPCVELLKSGNVITKEPAIVLPARGTGTTSLTNVKAGKREYVRIRVRRDDKWYIVYLPLSVHPQDTALSTQP